MGFQINHVVVSGNLTRDPENRALPSGTSVTNFGIAYNERRKDKTGEYGDVPHFFDVTCFGGQGDWLAKNAGKGDPVTVSGQLQMERWQTQDGQDRSKVSIVARDIVLGQRGGGANRGQPPAGQAQQSTGYGQSAGYESSGYGDGMAF